MNDHLKKLPDDKGYFGEYGGSFIPPDLQVEMDKITDAYFGLECEIQMGEVERCETVGFQVYG